jgi:cytochrome b561
MSSGARGAIERYDLVAIALHWTVAVLVAGMLVLGFVMVGVPRGDPMRGELFNLHKSFGVVALALMIARAAWRLSHRPPVHGLPGWNRALAGATHAGLYLLLLAQPLSGYAASELGKYGVKVFGLATPDLLAPDPGLREAFVAAHHALAAALVALIALHLAAVVWHAARGRRGVSERMLPNLAADHGGPFLRKAVDA